MNKRATSHFRITNDRALELAEQHQDTLSFFRLSENELLAISGKPLYMIIDDEIFEFTKEHTINE